MQDDEDCYKCTKTRQYFFTALTGFFIYELIKGRPYKSWMKLSFQLTPVGLFSTGAGVSYFQAEKIKAKSLLNNNSNEH